MSLEVIRTEIKNIMLGIDSVGSKVHDYERWAKTWEDYLAFFKSNGLIKGWTITRTSTPEIESTTTSNMRTHTFLIRGYYSLDDSAASEKVFQSIIEDVATAFRTKQTLNGKAFDSGPLQVSLVSAVMFGAVLCHYCELKLSVQEEEQWR